MTATARVIWLCASYHGDDTCTSVLSIVSLGARPFWRGHCTHFCKIAIHAVAQNRELKQPQRWRHEERHLKMISSPFLRTLNSFYNTTKVKRALWLVNSASTICPWVYACDESKRALKEVRVNNYARYLFFFLLQQNLGKIFFYILRKGTQKSLRLDNKRGLTNNNETIKHFSYLF